MIAYTAIGAVKQQSCRISYWGLLRLGVGKAIFKCGCTKNVTQITDDIQQLRDLNYRRQGVSSQKNFQIMIFSRNRISGQNQARRAVPSAFGRIFGTAADTQAASTAGMNEWGWSAANYSAVIASLWP